MEFVYREIDFKRDACISTMISFKPQKNHWFVSCTLKKMTHFEIPFQSALNLGLNQSTLKIIFKVRGMK